MSRFNCKAVEAVPTEIYRGKDGNSLCYRIRGEEKIKMISEETFNLYLSKYFFRVFHIGSVTKTKYVFP
jgi:hypothetical protein